MTQGLNYCDINKRLQVRLCWSIPGCTLADATQALSSSDGNHGLNHVQTAKLSVSHDYFSTNNRAVEEEMETFVSALANSMPNLKELNVQLLQYGFHHGIAGVSHKAIVPVVLLEELLPKLPGLKRIKFCDLQVIPSLSVQEEARREGQTCSIQRLATALQAHTHLERLELRHCSLSPVSVPLDPLFSSLSTIPTLQNLILQFPFQDGFTVGVAAINALTKGCPCLKELGLKGLYTLPTPAADNTSQPSACFLQRQYFPSLERLVLHLSPLTSASSAMAMAQAVANLVYRAPRLVALTLHLHLAPALGDHVKLQVLHTFQDSLALAWISSQSHCSASNLQELYIFCHDETTRRQTAQCISPQAICNVLECTPTLTRLCLPQCGELHECVSFWLTVNQSGIRQFLPLVDHQHHHRSSASGCCPIERLRQLRTFVAEAGRKDGTTQLSMLYYVLRECPSSILL